MMGQYIGFAGIGQTGISSATFDGTMFYCFQVINRSLFDLFSSLLIAHPG